MKKGIGTILIFDEAYPKTLFHAILDLGQELDSVEFAVVAGRKAHVDDDSVLGLEQAKVKQETVAGVIVGRIEQELETGPDLGHLIHQ